MVKNQKQDNVNSYVGEIRIFAGDYAPDGWYLCNGSIIPIGAAEMLFSVIGTTYGGDGIKTFALPDLKAKVPVGTGTLEEGSDYVLAQTGGEAEVTITEASMPLHHHHFVASLADANTGDPNNNYLAVTNGNNSTLQPPYPDVNLYIPSSVGAPNAQLDDRAVNFNASKELPHENRMPYLCLNYIISAVGILPE